MERLYKSMWSFIRTTVLLCVIFVTTALQAAHVPEPIARQVGEHFFAKPSIGRQDAVLSLAYVANGTTNEGAVTCLYVFKEASGGFVMIAGDDVVQPVLAYSTDQSFDGGEIPINVGKWIEGYKTEILAALEAQGTASVDVAAAWQELLTEEEMIGEARSDRAVNPLLQTNWDQSPYYNALCPGNSVTGCVATAMAQIMKFWNYPATGAGFHQYNHPQYGTLSANFGSTTYQWGSMPNAVTSSNTAVATLMYHCGVSVDMQYSPTVSGAWVIQSHSPTTNHNAEYALKTYFGYRPTLSGVSRSNYTQAQWIDLLRAELDASRPVLHDGFGDGGGHAFVCDGYDDNNFFHFNWGWSGSYNGYFTVNALNPTGTGTGGGTGGYNSGQEAVIGIQPPASSTTYNMALYDYVTPSATILGYGQAFNVTTNIVNNGTSTFSGDYCAAAFDNANNFVGYVETLAGYSLLSGNVYTNGLTFTTTGMYSMLPGTYRIGIFYKPTGGNWVQVLNNGSYTNMPQVTVVNYNSIALNSAITTSPSGNLTQGSPVSVNLNIINNGASTFFGDYSVGLYNLDGSWAQTIGTINESAGLPFNYTYLAPYLTFGPVSVTVAPGTYLLAMQHDPNGTGWQLTGTGAFLNPITVNVVAAALSPDIYEANNTPGQSYTLPVNFSGNNASPNTNGSNLHITTDLDHYKVVLPSGYDYSITARLHDSYNSGNGNTYTADGLFSWSTDGSSWSSTFDDVMPGTIPVNNGGTIYFRVAPFFAGEIGTYLLQLDIARTPLVGIDEAIVQSSIRVYPNPASGMVNLDLGGLHARIDRIVLYDAQGKVVKDLPESTWSSGMVVVDVSDLDAGCYLLQTRTDRTTISTQLLIAR